MRAKYWLSRLPFLRGDDGLTNRQRRNMARAYFTTGPGRRSTPEEIQRARALLDATKKSLVGCRTIEVAKRVLHEPTPEVSEDACICDDGFRIPHTHIGGSCVHITVPEGREDA